MPPKRSNKKKAKKAKKQKKGGGTENEKKATPCAATPRLLAARDGNAARIALRDATTAEQVREALRDGADANAQDEDGWTALMFTAERGGEHGAGMMRLLVDAGADANKQNEGGSTALMWAAQHGGEREHAMGMINVLIDAGADVNMQNNNGCTVKDFDSTNLFDNPGTGYGFSVSDSP